MYTVAAVCAAVALVAGCDDDRPAKGASSAAKRPKAAPGPVWNVHPTSIASLGDSITRGFDACSLLSDCPEASWATGTRVDSLARRLLPSPQDDSWNFAKTGARMTDLPDQMRSAIAHKPQLVTVLVGANDACRSKPGEMTSVDRFRTDFAASLKELRTALPTAQVYVASVPDLKRLWSQGSDNMLAQTIWKVGICSSMLKDSDAHDAASDDRRRAVDERVTEYNAALKDVCGKDPLCRYDPAVHDYQFSDDELSKWDWFHPSQQGQRALADMAYRRITGKSA